ncbi:MAG TPA: PIG-L family deacetylase [Patescibacteria group bacterium]|nr:PIG-L family deacetylase [Patescibacteria group bacterium]
MERKLSAFGINKAQPKILSWLEGYKKGHSQEAALGQQRFDTLIAEAKANGTPILTLSPHFDDAVLSVGGLLAGLQETNPLYVATIFTRASDDVAMGANDLFRSGYQDFDTLYQQRERENDEAVQAVGAQAINLPNTEAPWRTRRGRKQYPLFTYALGMIRRGEKQGFIDDIAGQIETVSQQIELQTGKKPLVLAPIAVRGILTHVDHVATRQAARQVDGRSAQVIYYADYPYDLHAAPQERVLQDESLSPATLIDYDQAAKRKAIELYASQVPLLFGNGLLAHAPSFPTIFPPEVFFV